MASIIEGAMKSQTESGGGDGANVDGVLDLFSGIQHTLGGLIVSSVYDSCTAYTTAFMFQTTQKLQSHVSEIMITRFRK
jgi:hypothetical protein